MNEPNSSDQNAPVDVYLGRFQSKVIVVTGAAQGIGRAVALRCAAEGAHVVAVDLDSDALNQLSNEADALDGECLPVCGNIADATTLDAMLATALSRFGRLDGLVNNAAVSCQFARFDSGSDEDFEKMIDVNVRPVWKAMQKARAALQESGGAIVNVASLAALRAERGVALYGMSKGAVANLTMNAALDFANRGIRVNAVCPGPVETPMLQQMEKLVDREDAEKARNTIAATIPMRRCGTVGEIAGVVAFLLSKDAGFITGVLLPVDGGKSVLQ